MRWYLAVVTTLFSLSLAESTSPEINEISSRHHRHRKEDRCPAEGFIIASLGHHESANWTGPDNWGYLNKLNEGILEQYPNMHSRLIHYPRASGKIRYAVADGVRHLRHRIKKYVRRCPETPIILLGYSEGAFITMNTLCGTDTPGYNYTAPLPRRYAKNIVAGIVYADTSQIAGQPYDMGTCQQNGTNARSNPQSCMPYANIIRSYCDQNDIWCCAGGDSLQVHHSYQGTYTNQSLPFVLSTYADSSLVKKLHSS